MIAQELIHEQTGNIYKHSGNEVLVDSPEYNEFQSAPDPTVLGYVFVEAVLERELRLAEALKNQNSHNP